jgi:hypothetical protein
LNSLSTDEFAPETIEWLGKINTAYSGKSASAGEPVDLLPIFELLHASAQGCTFPGQRFEGYFSRHFESSRRKSGDSGPSRGRDVIWIDSIAAQLAFRFSSFSEPRRYVQPRHEGDALKPPIGQLPRKPWTAIFALSLLANLISWTALAAEEETEDAELESAIDQVLNAIPGGKIILDVNFRWEYAKADQFQHSHSATVRTRFGFETKPVFGFSGLIEGVNTASPKPSAYFDGVENNDGPQTIVADPERTDINRVWLALDRKDWAGLKLKGGRQRIKLDDDRWVGNVGWRQNEQTFDAARVETNLGLEKLLLQYIYSWEVKRIFADEGPPPQRDFSPRSHFLNLAYDHSTAIKAVAFVYLIDPSDSTFRTFGSASYGIRFTGSVNLTDTLSVPYQASYAYQEDWGNNQVSYGSNYYMLEGGLKANDVGTLSAGYEVLGSDRDAGVVTPFATAHKFNGFADAFLNNGGTRGVRDLYGAIAPAIPIKGVTFKFIFHQFWDDQGGDNLGQEYDFVTTYQVNEYVGFLYKFAYYNGGKKPTFLTTTRSTLQTTLKF